MRCPVARDDVGIVQVTDGREHDAFELWRAADGSGWAPVANSADVLREYVSELRTTDIGWISVAATLGDRDGFILSRPSMVRFGSRSVPGSYPLRTNGLALEAAALSKAQTTAARS